jgi:hypothetical protein
MAREDVEIRVAIAVRLSWLDAIKLRLAGPEVRHAMLDEIRLKMTDLVLGRHHPENGE